MGESIGFWVFVIMGTAIIGYFSYCTYRESNKGNLPDNDDRL
jgi:hypothetical protein